MQTILESFQHDAEIETLLQLEDVKNDLSLKSILERFKGLGENAHNAQGAIFQEAEAYMKRNYNGAHIADTPLRRRFERRLRLSAYNDRRAAQLVPLNHNDR